MTLDSTNSDRYDNEWKIYGYWGASDFTGIGNFVSVTSIAFDSSDKLHVAYGAVSPEVQYDHGIGYSFFDGSAWHHDWFRVGGSSPQPQLAIDDKNGAHLTYYYWGIQYAYRDNISGEWLKSRVETGTEFGVPDIALDSIGNPHISYRENTSLKHAYWNGSTWEIEYVDTAQYEMDYISIAIDQWDQVHIGYVADGYPKYALGVPEPCTLCLLIIGGLSLIKRKHRMKT